MKQTEEKAVSDRRNFLKLASIGAAASGVAAATSTVSAQAEDKPARDGEVYRETEHVRRVYDLARF